MSRNPLNLNLNTSARVCLIASIWLVIVCSPVRLEGSDLNRNVSSAAEQASRTIDDTSKAALSKFEQMWQRVDERRLKNRTPDEIVAWALMGLLVGGVLAQFMRVNRVGALALGLAGSLLGGMVAHLAQIDLGLGPVLIRYEDLLFSLIGSLLVVFAIRLLLKRKVPKT